jgi:drug/metabolite transporter (DMT)-like permease
VLDAIQVALSNYLITFIGLPVAAIWLGEKLNAPAIVGGVLVFVSTLIITIVDFRMTHRVMIKPITQ